MGKKVTGKDAKRRAAKYDIMDIQDTVKKLVDKGFEVGVHGIDAWHDTAAACEEKTRISDISGKTDVGIRMHWLCFDKDTFQILEEAGFYYDTTFGYNDVVGYRAGTLQVFKPIGVKNIFELPLNIQDVALFNPKHMSLTKDKAWHESAGLCFSVSLKARFQKNKEKQSPRMSVANDRLFHFSHSLEVRPDRVKRASGQSSHC